MNTSQERNLNNRLNSARSNKNDDFIEGEFEETKKDENNGKDK